MNNLTGGGIVGERKISFVLHEPDDESLDSSNTTLTFQVTLFALIMLFSYKCFKRNCSETICNACKNRCSPTTIDY